jgi:REP element-mobilizing transposase RayT
MRARQLSFLPKSSPEHGGHTRVGQRKTVRPFDPKAPLHLVMKSSKARGERSMLHPRNRKLVDELVARITKKHRIRLLRYANVGNHLHLLILTRYRSHLKAFLRELGGAIAQSMTGARKGLSGKFWDQPPYTRIVTWGRQLRTLETYFIKNWFEAAGLLTRKAKAAGVRAICTRGWTGPPS